MLQLHIHHRLCSNQPAKYQGTGMKWHAIQRSPPLCSKLLRLQPGKLFLANLHSNGRHSNQGKPVMAMLSGKIYQISYTCATESHEHSSKCLLHSLCIKGIAAPHALH